MCLAVLFILYQVIIDGRSVFSYYKYSYHEHSCKSLGMGCIFFFLG